MPWLLARPRERKEWPCRRSSQHLSASAFLHLWAARPKTSSFPSVSEEEISNMRSELEKYGIQMPAFGKIGGILANELSLDEAACKRKSGSLCSHWRPSYRYAVCSSLTKSQTIWPKEIQTCPSGQASAWGGGLAFGNGTLAQKEGCAAEPSCSWQRSQTFLALSHLQCTQP